MQQPLHKSTNEMENSLCLLKINILPDKELRVLWIGDQSQETKKSQWKGLRTRKIGLGQELNPTSSLNFFLLPEALGRFNAQTYWLYPKHSLFTNARLLRHKVYFSCSKKKSK